MKTALPLKQVKLPIFANKYWVHRLSEKYLIRFRFSIGLSYSNVNVLAI